MWNRTGADQQHDLADQSHLGLFLPVFRTGKVEFAQPQELLHDFPVNGPLSRARYDVACVHVVFLPRELPEFARKYRHGDQPLEFFLVIDILIVLFDPEYRRSARRKTGPEEAMSAVSRERHSAAVVTAGNDVPILILEIRFGTVIDHVDRIVVKHFELRVEFIDMIPCDRSGRQHFVPGPAE